MDKGEIDYMALEAVYQEELEGKKMTDLQTLNRKVVEALGKCWCEPFIFEEGMSEEEQIEKDCKCKHCLTVFVYPICNQYERWNPNYILNPHELLAEMMKNKEWVQLSGTVLFIPGSHVIDVKYILDRTNGSFLKAVAESLNIKDEE